MPKKFQIKEKQEEQLSDEETTPIKVSVKEKKKRIMTPEMLEILKKAREKAIEVKRAIATPDKRLEHYKEKIKTTKAKERVSKKELMKQAIKEVEEELTPPPIQRQLPAVAVEPIKEAPKEVPIKEVPTLPIVESVKPKKKMVKYVYEEETDDEEDRVVVIKKPKPKEPVKEPVVPLKPLMKQVPFNSYTIFGNRR